MPSCEPESSRGRPSVLALDTLDDRREVFRLLDRLSPRRRLAYLAWCCRQVRTPAGEPVRVAARSNGDTFEVFFDWWHLGFQYDLDMDAAARALERQVRRSQETLWLAERALSQPMPDGLQERRACG